MAKATRTPLGTLEKVIIPSGNPDDWENAVQDDIDGEEETLPEISAKSTPPSKRTRDDFELDDDNEKAEELRANLRNASKAVTEKTHDEYMRCVLPRLYSILHRYLRSVSGSERAV